ncbi:MAG: ThiF family adenylyltransferase [Candidatus Micrarchaeota archaeon]|nr:ThiF family adenylyltransferase [Candidatus Micrarchaeota archaeon]
MQENKGLTETSAKNKPKTAQPPGPRVLDAAENSRSPSSGPAMEKNRDMKGTDGNTPTAVDADRFDRQKRVGTWDQDAIREQNALVIGAGALGNEVVKLLLQNGIGKITLLDFYTVVPANLNRCVFFSQKDADAHRFKADVIREKAAALFPDTAISADTRAVEKLPETAFKTHTAVFGCLDNLEARLFANAHAYGHAPLFDGGTNGFFGKIQVVCAPSACLECGMSKRDYGILAKRYSCVGEVLDYLDPKTPAIATTTSAIAAMQVNEWLCHVFGQKTRAGQYVHYDGLRQKIGTFDIPARKSCPVHG